MKKIVLVVLVLFLLPSILALSLNVEKQSSNGVMIRGINQPVTFDMKIKNLGEKDNLQFYNFLGFSMAPKGTVPISQGETKDVKILIFPKENLDFKGFYTFEYFIRGEDGEQIKEKLTIKIVDLKDVFEIGSGEINPESNSMKIFIKNNENFDFEDIHGKFSSVFFDFEETFSINAKETKEFEVILEKEDFKKIMAGFYTMNAEIIVDDNKVFLEGVVKFVEKDILKATEEEFGFFISTQLVEKENKGNTQTDTETVIRKNILSRLFTSFNPEPDSVEREGKDVYYTWAKTLSPGENMRIIVKTNWFYPFLLILFVIIIVILAKRYSKTDLNIKKKVSFVNTKGGEFALKVTILLNAKNHISRVSVIDRLPNLVKVHERFSNEIPKKISEKNKRVEWDFEELEKGETRVLTYIIYSKIGILGKFALPSTTAIYEKEGKIYETESNRAFFVSEQRKKVDEE